MNNIEITAIVAMTICMFLTGWAWYRVGVWKDYSKWLQEQSDEQGRISEARRLQLLFCQCKAPEGLEGSKYDPQSGSGPIFTLRR